jgi:hypothetical protein
VHLIEGLEGGRSALLHKLHHCAGDGELGVQVLTELLGGATPLEPAAGPRAGVAVLSYGGWLHVGINADADLVPGLERLRRGIEESFEQLARAAAPPGPA